MRRSPRRPSLFEPNRTGARPTAEHPHLMFDPPKPGHNRPTMLLEIDIEMGQFLVDNADANIRFALGVLESVSRETGEKLVAIIERNKELKLLVEQAKKKAGIE